MKLPDLLRLTPAERRVAAIYAAGFSLVIGLSQEASWPILLACSVLAGLSTFAVAHLLSRSRMGDADTP